MFRESRRFASALPGLVPLAAAALLLSPRAADAAQRGSEFDLTAAAAAGGMAGVGLARPQGPIEMLFGNPATMTQLKGAMSFTLGGTFVSPDLRGRTVQDLSAFGIPPFNGESALDQAAIPHAGAVSRLPNGVLFGFGFTGISGLGSDFRRVVPGLRPVADLKLFGANLGLAYPITPRLSIGAALVTGIGALQVGLLQNTADVNDFGVGVRGGITYDLGPVIVSGVYNSALSIVYDKVVEDRPDHLADVDLEQPQGVGIGIGTTEALWPNFTIAAEVLWKNWNSAETYRAFWDDQIASAIGIQYTLNKWTFRAGYSYSTDIVKDEDELGNSLGDLTTLAVHTPDGQKVAAPVTPTLIQLVQSTLTIGYWRQNIAGGIGYQLMPPVRLDLSASWGFDGTEEIGPFAADGNIIKVGMGFTWVLPMPEQK